MEGENQLCSQEIEQQMQYMDSPERGAWGSHSEGQETNLNKAKQERKEIEMQYHKIKNRISLLENQDNKALKNMRLTKEKARNLKEVKIRNKMHENYKNDVKQYEKLIVQRKNEYARQMYMNQKETVARNKDVMLSIAKSQAYEMKAERQNNEDIIQGDRQQEQKKKVQSAMRLKQHKDDTLARSQASWEKKKAQNRASHQQEITKETASKGELAKALEQLEKRENDMINRLQQTNSQQQKAIQEFEAVCKMEITDEIVQESIRSKTRSKSKTYSQQKSRYMQPRREQVSAFQQ